MIQFLKDSISMYAKSILPFFALMLATFCTLIMIASVFGAFYSVYMFDIKLTALTIGSALISFIGASLFYRAFQKLMD